MRTRKESDSGERTATDLNTAINTLTDHMMTMIATKDAGIAITGTDINKVIPQSMTGEGMTGVKGTGTFDEIRKEDIFTGKCAGRQLEITIQGQHWKTGKWKKPTG